MSKKRKAIKEFKYILRRALGACGNEHRPRLGNNNQGKWGNDQALRLSKAIADGEKPKNDVVVVFDSAGHYQGVRKRTRSNHA